MHGLWTQWNHSEHLAAWQKLEAAKHRLVYGVLCLGLQIQSKLEAPETGLSFDFLSEDRPGAGVTTGHSNGRITINIAEADPAYREKTREKMGEPYRTLIGHLRHEIGHYYWELMIRPDDRRLQEFRTSFGDERIDYAQTLEQYYRPDLYPFVLPLPALAQKPNPEK
ncbi:MAG: putative zinc-binding metallopeptidase [Thermodesulfobacteriota bacterium]